MTFDIPYYIRQVLREQKVVHIPGLGAFRMKHHSASFNTGKTILHPPTISIAYEDADDKNTALHQYMVDDNMSSKEAKSAISKWVNKSFERIVKKGSLSIPGLGTLQQNKDTNKLDFTPEDKGLTRMHVGLPEVAVSPIKRIVEQPSIVQHAVATSASAEREEKDYMPWWIPILAGCLVGLIYILSVKGFFSGNDKSKNSKEEAPIELSEERGADTSDSETDVANESLITEKYSEVDKIIDSGDSKVEEELSYTEPKSTANNLDKNTNTSTTKSIAKYADIIPASGKCVIITSSVKRSTNVTKMISIIERYGYEPHTSQYNGNTRVGIKFDCNNVDLEDFIQEIRSKISPKAWYLDPALRVEYE